MPFKERYDFGGAVLFFEIHWLSFRLSRNRQGRAQADTRRGDHLNEFEHLDRIRRFGMAAGRCVLRRNGIASFATFLRHCFASNGKAR